MPAAVLPLLGVEKRWAGELRQITVIFVNLGIDANKYLSVNDTVLQEVQDIVAAVQSAVYDYEGSLNKFLIDDKGKPAAWTIWSR